MSQMFNAANDMPSEADQNVVAWQAIHGIALRRMLRTSDRKQSEAFERLVTQSAIQMANIRAKEA